MDVDRFPPLADAGDAWRLPLCDTTALELGRALLCGQEASSREMLVETLQWDPFLALWCVCRAGAYFDQLPSCGEIAEWFLSYGFRHFESAGDTNTNCKVADDGFPVHDLMKTAVQSAFLANGKALGESMHLQPSYLLGLLTESTALLTTLSSDRQSDSSNVRRLIPPWLAGSLDKIDSHHELPDDLPEASVRKARLAIATGRIDLEANACFFVGEACRLALQRFRTQIPPARAILPTLCRKLMRLQKLETEFQATLEREKLASLKQLAYGASHEINNPLANISTRAQTLLRDEADPERRRQLSTINSQAFRAHEMISDMMLFAHPPELQLATTDVRALVERVLQEFDADARQQSTQLALEVGKAPTTWELDPVQITVALKALVRNSIEALGSGGQVVVSLQFEEGANGVPDSVLEIRVTDDGPGISAAIRRHLFDPFFSGREAGRGLGFGLAKCWRIVELHNGEILVDDRPRRGTTLAIRLPKMRLQKESATKSLPVRLEQN